MTSSGHSPAASQAQWRATRAYLNSHRHDLAQRAPTLAGTKTGPAGLLVADGWMPSAPVPLGDLELLWADEVSSPQITGREAETDAVRPLVDDHRRYPSYAEAMGDLARPAVFEDRPCYRLINVSSDGPAPRFTFTRGSFFQTIDVCEAAAHELAENAQFKPDGDLALGELPFRSLISEPCDLGRRSVIPAISVLTIRQSPRDSDCFVLHRRDETKVAHGGGLHQVMPVGVFQPSGPEPWNEQNDFDLWRSVTREYSEEFLGQPELSGGDEPISYDAWPFSAALTQARRAGAVRTYWLGLGIDPLSLVADILVVATFDASVYDKLLGDLVTVNDEGHVVTSDNANPHANGIPFNEQAVHHYAHQVPMQAAGAALLQLAWCYRRALVGDH